MSADAQVLHTLYRDHHSWLQGWLRRRLAVYAAIWGVGLVLLAAVRLETQAVGLVGMIGYALGVIGTVAFIKGFGANPFFKGFYIPWQVPLISLVAVVIILAITGMVAIRSVLKTEPASVFR